MEAALGGEEDEDEGEPLRPVVVDRPPPPPPPPLPPPSVSLASTVAPGAGSSRPGEPAPQAALACPGEVAGPAALPQVPFLILIGSDELETQLQSGLAEIDFGLQGSRIDADSFVGLRRVREAGPPCEAAAPSSPSSRSQGHWTLKDRLAAALHFRQWRTHKRPSVSPSLPALTTDAQQPPAGTVARPADGRADASWPQRNGQEMTLVQPSADLDKRGNGGDLRPKVESHPEDLATFELLWKVGDSGGPLQRLQFKTSSAGLSLILRRLELWSEESDSTRVVASAAARAALIANKGPWRGSNSFGRGGTARNASILDNRLHSKLSLQRRSPADESHLAVDAMSSTSTMSHGRSLGPKEIATATSHSQAGLSFETGQPAAMWREGGKPLRIPMRFADVEQLSPRLGVTKAPVEPKMHDSRSGGVSENTISWGSIMVEGKCLPKREGQSLVLKDNHFRALAAALPARYRLSTWVLLYSMSRDGISLKTLYRKVVRKGPSILVIRDTRQHVFGCFTSEEWKVATRYYGNGQCFVFQVHPELRAYRWTHANNFFMFSNLSMLAMGGGGHFSILLHGDLLTGHSGPCETFDSLSLASSEDFSLVHLEVWGFAR
eukprot:SM000206S06256  [mRNA]  locus=s206:41506:44839:- [translate_table: standard]